MLADVLAQAFDDDPPTRWMVRRERESARRAATRFFYRAALRHMGLPVGGVLATAARDGVLSFAPPGGWSLGWLPTLRMLPDWVRAVGVGRAWSSIRAAQAIEQLHPEVPHYYVFSMGVRPDAQGQGIGAALLRAVLGRADRDGVGTWLEATTERSARFYRRHGFEPRGVHRLPEGGPPMWLMWRGDEAARR